MKPPYRSQSRALEDDDAKGGCNGVIGVEIDVSRGSADGSAKPQRGGGQSMSQGGAVGSL